MKKACPLLLFFLISFIGQSQTIPAPLRLRCDFLLQTGKVSKNGLPVKQSLPEAVDQNQNFQFAKIYSTHPVFNWEVDTAVKTITAWQIMVATTPELLGKNQPDLWDSKKIFSNHSRAVYNGKVLKPGSVCYWKVRVWNEKNQ
ncbi:MAG: alpha-L-rhamnosidase, partial [Bacteroidetes bacterium]|nr:alpha-L-rhamnosidase [Bacteroidota bacterium]